MPSKPVKIQVFSHLQGWTLQANYFNLSLEKTPTGMDPAG